MSSSTSSSPTSSARRYYTLIGDHSSRFIRRRSSNGNLDWTLLVDFIRRKLPALAALLLGVFVGLTCAGVFSTRGVSSALSWRSRGTNGQQSEFSGQLRSSSYIPTMDQRYRVFEVLSTLSSQYTQQCTIDSQPLYRQQAHERYERLIGYQHSHPTTGQSLWSKIFRIGSNRDRRAPTEGQDGEKGDDNGDGVRLKRGSSTTTKVLKHGRGNKDHKYFFAINLYNSADIIPDLFSTMYKVASILGFHNVYISVYENGSTDRTQALLQIFSAVSRAVGIRVDIRTSLRTRGAFHHRIFYMADVRNAALAPLQELRDFNGEVFDSIIFMNDVLPCIDDLLELIWQSRTQNAAITCGSDYFWHDEAEVAVFGDNWVARDINGTALENAPFESVFRHPDSSARFQRHLPVQMQSCWNGIAILDPEPLYLHQAHVRFRMARIMEGECSASECSLLCKDYAHAGYGRIVMVPRVKLAYEQKVFDLIHPRRNTTTTTTPKKIIAKNPADEGSSQIEMQQDSQWFGPHDRLFSEEESEAIKFQPLPDYVWCWGWDGAGDIEGPDVEPVWEPVKEPLGNPTVIRHDRGFEL